MPTTRAPSGQLQLSEASMRGQELWEELGFGLVFELGVGEEGEPNWLACAMQMSPQWDKVAGKPHQ